jgi:hypothetical protein
MNNQYDNIIEGLTDLNKKGYNQNFSLTPNGIFSPVSSQTFSTKDVKIVSYHRFEGNSDMEDMAILYVLETSNGDKGVIIDAYGTYGNNEIGEFLKQIEYK